MAAGLHGSARTTQRISQVRQSLPSGRQGRTQVVHIASASSAKANGAPFLCEVAAMFPCQIPAVLTVHRPPAGDRWTNGHTREDEPHCLIP
jgi:hypothetical protein